MSFLAVVYVVLMILWLFFGCYTGWDPARPYGVGTTLLPWLCVALLGYLLLGGAGVPPAAVR